MPPFTFKELGIVNAIDEIGVQVQTSSSENLNTNTIIIGFMSNLNPTLLIKQLIMLAAL